MKKHFVTLAVLAAASQQSLMAGYRVVESVDQSRHAATSLTVSTPVHKDQTARILELEAEVKRLRALIPAESTSNTIKNDVQSIGFPLGGTKVSQSAEKNAQLIIRARSAKSIEVIGYTDNTGNSEINKKIALKRAQLVKDFLVKNGISPKIIKVTEKAGVYLTTNSTPEGRAINRRSIVKFD